MAELTAKAKLFAVTNLKPEVLKAIAISPYKDIQSAFDYATKLKGKDSRILVVLDGCLTVPVPRN